MKRNLIAVLLIIVLCSSIVLAQERSRSIRPAFPIGAGEEMLVIAGKQFISTTTWTGTREFDWGTASGHDFTHVELPVGATIKRILGNFVDQTGTEDLTIFLKRIKDDGTEVTLRSFTTASISSSSVTLSSSSSDTGRLR